MDKPKNFDSDDKFDQQTEAIHKIIGEIREERCGQGYKVSALLIILVDNGEKEFVHLHGDGIKDATGATHVLGVAMETLDIHPVAVWTREAMPFRKTDKVN